jgi:hypothetical protein
MNKSSLTFQLEANKPQKIRKMAVIVLVKKSLNNEIKLYKLKILSLTP